MPKYAIVFLLIILHSCKSFQTNKSSQIKRVVDDKTQVRTCPTTPPRDNDVAHCERQAKLRIVSPSETSSAPPTGYATHKLEIKTCARHENADQREFDFSIPGNKLVLFFSTADFCNVGTNYFIVLDYLDWPESNDAPSFEQARNLAKYALGKYYVSERSGCYINKVRIWYRNATSINRMIGLNITDNCFEISE